jgi:2-polyprenyl-6-methoxyphenol hydroxylase-like FAD-dependent oxidoreductase
MRVIVVGGGIGGLSATIAMRREGHDVVTLEQTAVVEPIGAGITLFDNAMRALDTLGVADAVRNAGSAVADSAILTQHGRPLAHLPLDLLDGAVAIHRGELQAALLRAAGSIQLGARVTSIDQTADGVVATLADGSREHGDLLIGADGLRSVVRRYVAPATPRYAGYTAWRGVSPAMTTPGHLSESWGVGERFGIVDIGSGTYWFATKNAPEREPEQADRRKTEIAERFGHWHDPIGAVLDATPESAMLRNDVYFLEPLASWSKGRLVLLGDAAHAITPGVGQGAAQAIEDAVSLAAEIANAEDLAAGLTRYESSGRPRVKLALKLGRRADAAAQLANPLACRIRNAVVSRLPVGMQLRQLAPLVRRS